MIRFQESYSWFRKSVAGLQTVKFQASVFVGAFDLSRRVSKKIEDILPPLIFFL